MFSAAESEGESSSERDVPFRHRLVPLERSAALWLMRRQRTRSPDLAASFEKLLGGEGIALFASLCLWAILGMALGFAGLGCLFSSGGRGHLELVGYILLVLGIALVCVGLMRGMQMIRERSRHRAQEAG